MSNAVTILLVCVLIYVIQDDIYDWIVRIENCNSIDGRCYDVVGKFKQSEQDEASARLAYVNLFCVKLIKHMRNKYIIGAYSKKNGSDINHRKELTYRLMNNYNPDKIVENDPNNSINTSYVQDKGDVFAVCLRQKKNNRNKFHDLHIVEFVVLHELSHLASIGIGHDTEFWHNFKILLQEAKDCGIHDPINYRNNPTNYCSLDITYNPYYDNKI